MGPSPRASLENVLWDDNTCPRMTLTGSCYLFARTGKWSDFCRAQHKVGWVGVRSRNQVMHSIKTLSLDLGAQFHRDIYLWPQSYSRGENSSFSLCFHGITFTLFFTECCQNKVKRRPTRRRVPICAGFLHNCTLTLSKVDTGQVGKNVPGP